MGGGTYSFTSRMYRHVKSGHATAEFNDSGEVVKDSVDYSSYTREKAFKNYSLNSAMNPKNAILREARDSEEHPNSLAIIIALDVTGSMGHIPHDLVKEGLPNIMEKIIQNSIPDPQVLFLGIGDHEIDQAPLQVGQFESGDELLDKWLTEVYLEGGGGGNYGESYLLAWYFASQHTSIDCFEKRKQKGFLFTIGDEPTLKTIPKEALQNLMGTGQFEDYSANELYDKAREMYNVFHIHIAETGKGRYSETIDGWKQLLGDNLKVVDHHKDVARIIADTVVENKDNINASTIAADPKDLVKEEKTGDSEPEEML